jgi:hypothetical protein
VPETLFPVIEIPTISAPGAAEEQKYKPSIYFDFEKGDFVRDGAGKLMQSTGREAYMQWCIKVVMTERFDHLAYGTDIGTEMVDAFSQADRAATESAIERTINECLMVNPKTEYVREYSFTWSSAEIRCSFVVKGQDWEEQRLTAALNI